MDVPLDAPSGAAALRSSVKKTARVRKFGMAHSIPHPETLTQLPAREQVEAFMTRTEDWGSRTSYKLQHQPQRTGILSVNSLCSDAEGHLEGY